MLELSNIVRGIFFFRIQTKAVTFKSILDRESKYLRSSLILEFLRKNRLTCCWKNDVDASVLRRYHLFTFATRAHLFFTWHGAEGELSLDWFDAGHRNFAVYAGMAIRASRRHPLYVYDPLVFVAGAPVYVSNTSTLAVPFSPTFQASTVVITVSVSRRLRTFAQTPHAPRSAFNSLRRELSSELVFREGPRCLNSFSSSAQRTSNEIRTTLLRGYTVSDQIIMIRWRNYKFYILNNTMTSTVARHPPLST